MKGINKKVSFVVGSCVFIIVLCALTALFFILPLNPSYSLEVKNLEDDKLYVSNENPEIEVSAYVKESLLDKQTKKNNELALVGYINEDEKVIDEVKIEKKEDNIAEINLKGIKDGSYDFTLNLLDENASETYDSKEMTLVVDNKDPKIKKVTVEKTKLNDYKKIYRNERNVKDVNFTFSEEAAFEISCGKVECDKFFEMSDVAVFDKELDDESKNLTFTMEYTLRDKAGNEKHGEIKFVYDDKKPKIAVASSTNINTTIANSYVLEVESNEKVTVTVGKKKAKLYDKTGRYEITGLDLNEGDNKFTIKAIDQAGNEATKKVTITVTKPVVSTPPSSSSTTPPSSTTITLSYCYSQAPRMCSRYTGTQRVECESFWKQYCDAHY